VDYTQRELPKCAEDLGGRGIAAGLESVGREKTKFHGGFKAGKE